MSSIYEIEVETIDGQKTKLDTYRGDVLLIVNTASKCGFTPQFAGLEALHKKYANRGLRILGFPCNQFGKQDPGSNEEIAEFCERNYGVSFP
ncbi:MAG: glutathione peroxidase, partial [Sandaracinaceae bacterium]|nr:glutathione peroxidase [Sandaracinaceae bacterium]